MERTYIQVNWTSQSLDKAKSTKHKKKNLTGYIYIYSSYYAHILAANGSIKKRTTPRKRWRYALSRSLRPLIMIQQSLLVKYPKSFHP